MVFGPGALDERPQQESRRALQLAERLDFQFGTVDSPVCVPGSTIQLGGQAGQQACKCSNELQLHRDTGYIEPREVLVRPPSQTGA